MNGARYGVGRVHELWRGHRYLAEYDFRYNHRVALGHSDIDRTKAAIRAVAGKRLTYRQPH
jgi:hypothetical protein